MKTTNQSDTPETLKQPLYNLAPLTIQHSPAHHTRRLNEEPVAASGCCEEVITLSNLLNLLLFHVRRRRRRWHQCGQLRRQPLPLTAGATWCSLIIAMLPSLSSSSSESEE